MTSDHLPLCATAMQPTALASGSSCPAGNSPRPTRPQHRRLAFLTLGALLLACTPPLALVPADDFFERHELTLDGDHGRTIVPGFFTGAETAELAVVHLDDDGARHLKLLTLTDEGWATSVQTTLRPDVLCVDVASIGGRDRLLTYAPGRLDLFDPDTASERPLVTVDMAYSLSSEADTGFDTPPGCLVRQVDISHDLNDDGRDDLVFPGLDGFRIALQREDGSFDAPVLLGTPEPFADETPGWGEHTWGEIGVVAPTVPAYLSRMHRMDEDLDGRTDLVFWDGEAFAVHHQDEGGGFDPVASTFDTDVAFDADGVYALMFGFPEDDGMAALMFGIGPKTERTILAAILDVDGDGLADLVTETVSGRSRTKMGATYAVHLGEATRWGLRFTTVPALEVEPHGRAAGMQPWGYSSHLIEDLDGDGRPELLRRDVTMTMGGMIRAAAGGAIGLDVEVFRLTTGREPDEPAARREVRPQTHYFSDKGIVHFPGVLLGDVTGDGRQELLVGHGTEELHVYIGLPGDDPWTRQPVRLDVIQPTDERSARLFDLDGDGKQDLLIHHTPSDSDPDMPQRLVVHLTR
jgi:hypothetical protein